MKKILTSLALCLTLYNTPASASIENERSEQIFSIAKVECRAALRASNSRTYLTKVMSDMNLDIEESLLLVNYCLMFAEGLKR